jgi:hypothetical protein
MTKQTKVNAYSSVSRPKPLNRGREVWCDTHTYVTIAASSCGMTKNNNAADEAINEIMVTMGYHGTKRVIMAAPNRDRSTSKRTNATANFNMALPPSNTNRPLYHTYISIDL